MKHINFKIADFNGKNFGTLLSDMRGSLKAIENGEGYVFIDCNDSEVTDENITAVSDLFGTLESEDVINEDWGFEKLFDGATEFYNRGQIIETIKTGESVTLFAWNPEA